MAAPIAIAPRTVSISRFAPAPTGHLHLGHVVNALYVWGWAAHQGASVLLRVEDHDRQRSRAVFERRLLDDLDWLGFIPDRFTTDEFRAGPCASRQSDRDPIYRAAAAALIDRGRVYGCVCTRQDLADRRDLGAPRLYPGTCRHRGIAPREGIAWRAVIDPGVETFEDALVGACRQDPARDHGDVVIRDRHGNWTYQFAVTVDDRAQGIDLVIRGRDLLASTGLQMALGRAIGRETPARFAHHPLVMKAPGVKLSKSDGDSGVRDLRDAGWSAARVIGAAAHRAGLAPADAEIPAGDAPRLFGSGAARRT